MIKWLQRQSAAVHVCFAFGYCAIYYGLHFLSGTFSFDTVTNVLVTVFPVFYVASAQLLFDPLLSKPSRQTFQLMVLPVVLLCVVLLFWQFETLIFIAILLPIFMALGWFGQLITRVVLRKALVNATSDTLNVSLLLLPILAVPLFGQFEFSQVQMRVMTQIAIEAPKDMVWANTIEISEIQSETLVAFDPHIAPQGGIVNMQWGHTTLHHC